MQLRSSPHGNFDALELQKLVAHKNKLHVHKTALQPPVADTNSISSLFCQSQGEEPLANTAKAFMPIILRLLRR